MPNGKGFKIFDDGSVYEGYFMNGKYHGYGRLITDGNIYEGQWSDNKLNGKGTYIHEEGTLKYTGEWLNNE